MALQKHPGQGFTINPVPMLHFTPQSSNGLLWYTITLYQACQMLVYVCLRCWDITAQLGNAFKETSMKRINFVPSRLFYLPLFFHRRFWFPQRRLSRRFFVYVLLSNEPQQQFPVETKNSLAGFITLPGAAAERKDSLVDNWPLF